MGSLNVDRGSVHESPARCQTRIITLGQGFSSFCPRTTCVPRNLQIVVLLKIIIIIISFISYQEQRASTKRLQRVLFWASLFTSPHVSPSFSVSSATVLLQVCFGLLLHLFPYGFQSNAVFSIHPLSFLNVCPIQFHFRSLVSNLIYFWPDFSHDSLFDIISGHIILLKIHRKN